MKKIRLLSASIFLIVSLSSFGGGILTNTTMNVAFLRNPARNAAIGIDGVYVNPAGVAFLGDGLYFSFNLQNVSQLRVINSGMYIDAFKGTPFQYPLMLNTNAVKDGNTNGVKQYVGEASAPIVPSIQVAYNKGKWGFQLGLGVYGGGGKCTFNDGLASFERQISLIPSMLYANGITSGTPAYSVSSYLKGKQFIYGVHIGATYKVSDNVSVFGGMRFNYVWNSYNGSITNISANIGDNHVNLFNFFGEKENALRQAAIMYSTMAGNATSEAEKIEYTTKAEAYTKQADAIGGKKDMVKDRYLDCTQTGWGLTPVIGIDVKLNKLNLAGRLEFNTHINVENDTKRDDTGLFSHGVKTPNDLPGILSLGAQYEILPKLRVNAGWNYYFDKSSSMDKDKQKLLTSNTQEYLIGAEYDINRYVQVSAGLQRTKYGVDDGNFLNDMSFVTSSYSIGLGAGVNVTEKIKVNVGYFWTNYETVDKQYVQAFSSGEQSINANCSDSFTRTNRVIGLGVDVKI